ncbi:MAG TPA: hypothetical protein VFK37_04940 [Bacillales bacterium]|nr:hypothetical protein [Bacillales bacterium]
MDLMKFKMYLDILGICFTVALTYIMIANAFLGLSERNDLMGIGILAFAWVVLLTRNDVARTLWKKWRNH